VINISRGGCPLRHRPRIAVIEGASNEVAVTLKLEGRLEGRDERAMDGLDELDGLLYVVVWKNQGWGGLMERSREERRGGEAFRLWPFIIFCPFPLFPFLVSHTQPPNQNGASGQGQSPKESERQLPTNLFRCSACQLDLGLCPFRPNHICRNPQLIPSSCSLDAKQLHTTAFWKLAA
jgi:hypothetical protein